MVAGRLASEGPTGVAIWTGRGRRISNPMVHVWLGARAWQMVTCGYTCGSGREVTLHMHVWLRSW